MADTYDLLTLAEGKRAINQAGLSNADSILDLEQTITAVSQRLVQECGPIVNAAVTHTVVAPTGLLFLPVPVGSPSFGITLTAVTEYVNGTPTVLTAEDFDTAGTYRYDPTLGSLRRRSSWSDTLWAQQEVVVAYTAGRAANTAAVPAKFKKAASIIVNHDWRIEHGAASESFRGNEDLVYLPQGFLVPKRAHDYLLGEFLPPAVA